MGWYINIIKAVKVKAEKPEKRSSEKIEATTYAENIVTALITEGLSPDKKTNPHKSPTMRKLAIHFPPQTRRKG